MSWTSPQDITDRWVGGGTPTDADLMQALINDAEAIILSEYPRIQDRIDDSSLPLGMLKLVVSRMVSRVLRNPDMVSYWQQQTGPFGQARNFGENVDIWMNDQEKDMLAPKKRGKAFSTNLGKDAVPGSDSIIWLEIRG
jgi:hypothetical protein